MFHRNDENVAIQANTSASHTYQKAMSGINLASSEDLKSYMLKDLRILCREKGVNPAGGKEALIERLIEAQSAGQIQIEVTKKDETVQSGDVTNNYSRQEGQNIGNFITDRPSSRVLQQPGGGSSISFTDGSAPAAANNNYARTGGQNVGNFLTDRNSSRVLAPPGGGQSQITFSDGHEAKQGGDPPPKFADSAPPANSLQMGGQQPGVRAPAPSPTRKGGQQPESIGVNSNNYVRAEGQNVGNFITDRSSSRVLAPPGGASSFSLG